VGLATALRLAVQERTARRAHATLLRDRLLDAVRELIHGTILTGPMDRSRRLPNNFSCCFEGLDSETLLQQLDLAGFAASSGSACTSGSLDPSHVLTAMGISPETARGSLRLTLGTGNTMDQIEALLALLPGFVQRLRGLRGGVQGQASLSV
jgi:cysteine desulfurase